MAKTVVDQFAETLAAAGVKRIYGIVGDSLNGLTDAIGRQEKIEWAHVRHEERGIRLEGPADVEGASMPHLPMTDRCGPIRW
jgi:Thiamine pyrophosphate enzyme, N-terminal TPP binding domain